MMVLAGKLRMLTPRTVLRFLAPLVLAILALVAAPAAHALTPSRPQLAPSTRSELPTGAAATRTQAPRVSSPITGGTKGVPAMRSGPQSASSARSTLPGNATAAQTGAPPASPITGTRREAYLQIMLTGSMNMSRTKVQNSPGLHTLPAARGHVSQITERNFREAAAWVLDHPQAPINLDTAVTLNRILTRDLVEESFRGKYNHFLGLARRVDTTPEAFYSWLETPQARQEFKDDPVAFADKVHQTITTFDAFPEGNGRTGRMLSDLVLIRAGRAPARYRNMAEYFSRGTTSFGRPGAEPTLPYFREIAAGGDAAASKMMRAAPAPRGAMHAPRPARVLSWAKKVGRLSLGSSAGAVP
jgi:hypothetical protein